MQSTHHVQIRRSPAGRTTVEVDGVDITGAVTGYTIEAHARTLPNVVLHLIPGRTLVDGPATTQVDERTRAALLALGWSPPAGLSGEIVVFEPYPHPQCGNNPDRQSVGDPGHCENCAMFGHVVAHPDLGCGDVGCTSSHEERRQ